MTKQEIEAWNRTNHSDYLCSIYDFHSDQGMLAAIQLMKEFLLDQDLIREADPEKGEMNFCSRSGGMS